jgi:predicted lipoprotein with Yx(FWY)xxD motif
MRQSARPRTALGGLAALFLGSLILAACSSSPSGSSSGTSTTSGGSGSSTAVVMTANNAKYGTILVDPQGRTLYTLVSGGHPIPCVTTCGHTWPPLLVPAGDKTLTGGSGVTGLGKSASGTVVEYQGFPLFRYSGDTAPGEANGNGISSNGGTWYVLKAGAQPGTPVTS